MIKNIYLIGIILVSLIIFILYILKEREHQKELEKIKILEEKERENKRRLEIIRSKTQPCHIENLNDPRSCYYKSNFSCSWNEEAQRCDKK